ncbi:MAG: hypothetical protein HXX10_01785 [Rhodoplanes sp.]|uniref:hypothetical protein n=1 Tax=Rhodoplanes sp. TaxID=1968906 RepID=UPI0018479822|nr:hypothetical protein [Rhodoplanes sp.]NVO12745.1 hypothetical protein [Rhodoplanes sp.]
MNDRSIRGVTRGLDPRVHPLRKIAFHEMDGRVAALRAGPAMTWGVTPRPGREVVSG